MTDINYHDAVVAFDLDDTLFRERDFCRSGFKYLLRNISLTDSMELYEKMNSALCEGENPFDCFEDYFIEKDLNCRLQSENGDSKWLRKRIDEYRRHLPDKLQPAPGVEDVIKELNGRGIKMAIVTDGRSVTQRNKIRALGLDTYIPSDNIFISEEMGVDKLSPDSFITIVRKYPEASKFFYIGNNERKDFLQPNLLGWTTIKIERHPDDVHPDYVNEDPTGRPQITIKDFKQLSAIIL